MYIVCLSAHYGQFQITVKQYSRNLIKTAFGQFREKCARFPAQELVMCLEDPLPHGKGVFDGRWKKCDWTTTVSSE